VIHCFDKARMTPRMMLGAAFTAEDRDLHRGCRPRRIRDVHGGDAFHFLSL
jgi:hypothetical protein